MLFTHKRLKIKIMDIIVKLAKKNKKSILLLKITNTYKLKNDYFCKYFIVFNVHVYYLFSWPSPKYTTVVTINSGSC